jgi:hypothetical protein
VKGAVESALDAGFVTAQGSEGVPAVAVVAEDVGETVVGDEVGVFLFHVLLLVQEAEPEEGGFHEAEAGEAPGGHDDLVDEEGFDGADGLEVVEEGLKGLVEEVRVLVGYDGMPGGEAMFQGIAPGSGLALGGFGAGAVLGVGAVGVDLLLRGHNGV